MMMMMMMMMLMMMMLLFVNAANWKRWEQSLPARAGPAFEAASRSYTLIQDDDVYDDDDDGDRKWKDDYDGEDDGPQLPQVRLNFKSRAPGGIYFSRNLFLASLFSAISIQISTSGAIPGRSSFEEI